MLYVDAHPLVTIEIQPGFGEQVQRVWCAHVVVDAEAKVELPCADLGGKIAVLVAERDAQLDELEQIDVASQCLVVVVRRAFECAYWPRDDTGELGVLV